MYIQWRFGNHPLGSPLIPGGLEKLGFFSADRKLSRKVIRKSPKLGDFRFGGLGVSSALFSGGKVYFDSDLPKNK